MYLNIKWVLSLSDILLRFTQFFFDQAASLARGFK